MYNKTLYDFYIKGLQVSVEHCTNKERYIIIVKSYKVLRYVFFYQNGSINNFMLRSRGNRLFDKREMTKF